MNPRGKQRTMEGAGQRSRDARMNVAVYSTYGTAEEMK
jgi:hypothetical protein